jgi:hypothetical protein
MFFDSYHFVTIINPHSILILGMCFQIPLEKTSTFLYISEKHHRRDIYAPYKPATQLTSQTTSNS